MNKMNETELQELKGEMRAGLYTASIFIFTLILSCSCIVGILGILTILSGGIK